MRPIDPIRIRELLSNIGEANSHLKELGQLSLPEFLGDFKNTASAKYLLIVATEAAIDVCNHIVARQGGQAPKDYADCFTLLTKLQVIDPNLANQLRQMARFRNLVVHLYWKVDNAQVYEIIQHNLTDLEEFQHQISTWVISMGE